MGSSKHTPGPWSVGQYTPTAAFLSIKNHSCVCDPETMALIACTGPADDRQSQIDADLIAAAPDLLEALQSTYEALLVSYPLHSIEMDRRSAILEQARAAIAKATGATS